MVNARSGPDDADQAAEALARMRPLADADPCRPAFHFRAPAGWMNDPNAILFHQGWCHLFYQHHPYDDGWGDGAMSWGHARSQDLLHWEHLPVALMPDPAMGESGCWSGSGALDDAGRPILFYTSVGPRRRPLDGAEQWAAVGDDELLSWRPHPANPILAAGVHGGLQIEEWRDPCVFREDGRWYLALGGRLAGGGGCVCLYRSEDLERWTFLGVPLAGEGYSWECPSLFRIGDRWVLIVSPYGAVRYCVGRLDLSACRFEPEVWGDLDCGRGEWPAFYAPSTTLDPRGRRLLWGWVRGFRGGRGWNGCLSLPRVLSLDAEGRLQQEPLPELSRLRHGERSLGPVHLTPQALPAPVLARGQGLEVEVELQLPPASAGGLLLRSGDEPQGTGIIWDGANLRVGQDRIPWPAARNRQARLRLFLDRSVLELFVEGGPCVTQVRRDNPGPHAVSLLAEAGQVLFPLARGWQVRSTW